MLPEEHHEERRVTRTVDPLVSLCRLFEAARRREGLTTVVLADASGIAIAGAGPAAACEELAAISPFLSPANDTIPCRFDVLARALAVQKLRIDGIEVFLCAVSGAPSSPGAAPKAPEMAGVQAGCERILSRMRRGAHRI